MRRIRIAYSKGVELQYTGNLDMHKVWERTFRRAQLPLAYSQGFHPQPKLQQAAPLPLGFTSSAEILDVWLDTEIPLEQIMSIIITTAQPGIKVREVMEIPVQSEPLPNLVTAVEYTVICDEFSDSGELDDRIKALLALDHIDRQRRGKNYDLRPLVISLKLGKTDPITLVMTLSSLPGATGRPEEVLEELGVDPYKTDIARTQLFLNTMKS